MFVIIKKYLQSVSSDQLETEGYNMNISYNNKPALIGSLIILSSFFIPEALGCTLNCEGCMNPCTQCIRGYYLDQATKTCKAKYLYDDVCNLKYCRSCVFDKIQNRCSVCKDDYGIEMTNNILCTPCSMGCTSGCKHGGTCASACAQPFSYDVTKVTIPSCKLPANLEKGTIYKFNPLQGPLAGGTLVRMVISTALIKSNRTGEALSINQTLIKANRTGEALSINQTLINANKTGESFIRNLEINFREVLLYFDGITRPVNITEVVNSENTLYSQKGIAFRSPEAFYPGNSSIYIVIDGTMYDTLASFEYLQPPSFTDISPTQHFVSGGTTITINGNNLENSEYSLLLKVEIKLVGTRGEGSITEERTTCDASNAVNGYILCTVPTLRLPGNYNKTLVEQSDPNFRRTNNSTSYYNFKYYSNDGKEMATIELLICINSENCEPLNAPVIWVPEPYIGEMSNLIEVEVGVGKTVQIKGERLLSGAQDTDYLITVGNDECRLNQKKKCWLVSVTDYMITVNLPLYEPSERTDDECKNGMEMIVSLGEKSYLNARYACVLYTGDQSDIQMYIIIGAAGGGGLLLIVITIIICCCICCSKKRRERRANERRKEKAEKERRNNQNNNKNIYTTNIGKR